MKKLFLVKREVMAETIEEAMKKKGRIYSVEEALVSPEEPRKVGFVSPPIKSING